ncbi:hypothetical protein MTO96_025266 [Rhipicephalus appendiculatus]
MSSAYRKAAEDRESSSIEKNKPTAAVDATATSVLAAAKPEAPSRPSDSEKTVAASGRDIEGQPQNRRKTSVAISQPFPYSMMSPPAKTAVVSDARTSQATTEDVSVSMPHFHVTAVRIYLEIVIDFA